MWVSMAAFILTAVVIANAEPVALANEGFVPVESYNQLWRFQVGKYWREGISIGDEYICLLGSHNKFVRAANGDVLNDMAWCKRQERLKIEFLEGNLVRLQSVSEHQYLACLENGHMGLVDSQSNSSLLRIYITVDGDKVAFFSQTNNRYMSAKADGKVMCDTDDILADEQYQAWKGGPEKAWEPRDEWQIVGAYDNRFCSSVESFMYYRTVGVEIGGEWSQQAGASAQTDMVSMIGLRNFFSEHVHPTVMYEWSKTSSKTWTKARVITASFQVTPGKKTILYQAVGFYGVFTIYSNFFQARDSVNETVF